MAETAAPSSAESRERLPCSWRYVSVCILLPALGGGLNGFIYSGYSLYFREMGWDLGIAGICLSLGALGRIFFQQLQMRLGLWTAAPMAATHVALAILVTIFPDKLWAVLGQLLAILFFDTTVTVEVICFEVFAGSENLARQAAGTLLASFTVGYAGSATYGGIIYDLWRWTGMSWFHTVASSVNLLLILTMPPVRNSWRTLRAKGASASSQEVRETRKRVDSAQSDDSFRSQAMADVDHVDLDVLNCPVASEKGMLTNHAEEDPEKGEVQEVQVEKPASSQTTSSTRSGKIPANTIMPAIMICLNGFANHFSYHTVWVTYAIFFKEHHGWNEATWAGIAQTSGDILAALAISLCLKRKVVDLKETRGIRWLWYATTGQPYNVSCWMVIWVFLNLAIASPLLPISVVAQVLMGTAYTYTIKANTDLNVFYSLGSAETFIAMQTATRNADSLGTFLAGLAATQLYEVVDPCAPFYASALVVLVTLLLFTVCFCRRLGFGKNIDAAEEARCNRLQISRSSSSGSRSTSF
ncbi:unnamed protein product [Symbiodinium natans]|uniref:Uncharacterized protein n=1 Tax=Symbiodinium natans TaxID=878477 RepID=A0A812JE10_9DINO|nr:unnamed protein product [Symbiodinium natans]